MIQQIYTIHGEPTRVFPFRPNWAAGVTETLEWKTDILKAHDGTEQRRCVRQEPRRGFEFSLMLKGEGAALFDMLMYSWMSRHFALPVWVDRTHLMVAANQGQQSLSVDTTLRGFRASDYALILQSPFAYEVVRVDAVTPSSLVLHDPVLTTWPSGTSVYPLVHAHLTGATSSQRHTSNLIEAAPSFITSPDVTYSGLNDIAPSNIYDGAEVIMAKPNWKDAISNEFSRDFDTIDAGYGPIGFRQKETTTRITKPFSWFLKSRQQVIDFKNLMGRLRGQSKSCWMPSWTDDLTLASSNAANWSMLTLKGTAFNSLVGVDLSRDRLMIKLPNGNVVFRKIELCVPDYFTETTSLTLDTPIGATIGNAGAQLTHLLRCRLATDKIVIPWLTETIALPSTAFVTVKS